MTRRLGLQFDDTRLGLLAEVFERRLAQLGASSGVYLHDLDTVGDSREASALARELTVGETYFFRNSEQFLAAGAIAVELMQAGRTKLRVLSAGCSSGEEVYSFAIMLRERLIDPAAAEILGIDVNPAALEKARRGRYSSWSVRATPPGIEQQWFRREGRELVLGEAARAGVSFEERNLATDETLWQPNSFDVVFCRNVLMYFAPDIACAVVARIARALRPGGHLFLGHAETLRGLSDAFHLRHTHGTFYYQLKADGAIIAPPRREPVAASAIPGAAAVLDGDWVEAIRAASDRVNVLASASQALPRSAAALASWDLSAAFDLLKAERFTEALAHIRQLPAASERDPDVLLLKATLLAHSGQPQAAEEVCRNLLRLDDLNAGAYYVLALCREAKGDHAAAAENDRTAVYLDPAFAMPRLHLGLLARRRADRDTARRELTAATTLLKREEPSRLLLFGGGFNRDTLLAFCESALRDCGGPP